MAMTRERICICVKCGSEYREKIGDNLKPDEAQKLIYCKKCRDKKGGKDKKWIIV